MKAQAAASIAQYERSVLALASYQRGVELGLTAALRTINADMAPADTTRPSGSSPIGAVVFGSDEGLIGRFNDVIADYAAGTLAKLPQVARVWTVGERVQARLTDAHLEMKGSFPSPDSVRAITSLVGRILLQTESLRMQGPASDLYLFYNRPTQGATYTPVGQRLLPLDAAWRRERSGQPWPTRTRPEVLGAVAPTLKAFIGEYLFVALFRACAESLASENASRLAAMQRAEKSIDDRLTALNATFHRLRQSSIDEELFDVISGFEALSKQAPVARQSSVHN
jgi:F-type H+-transporting ATPase subunit gamma